MPDQCPKCGGQLPEGTTNCPACSAASTDPPAPNKFLVLSAALLPLIAIVVVVSCLGAFLFVSYRLIQKAGAHSSTAPPTSVITQVSPPPPSPKPPSPTPPVSRVVDSTPHLPTPPSPTPAPGVAPKVVTPAPELSDVVPPIAPPGSKMVLRGENLAAVNQVLLIDSHGAAAVPAKIIFKMDRQVIVEVPGIPFADHAIDIAVLSPGGAALLIDQHTGVTPWGTDGHLHDTTIHVRASDEIQVLDHMLVLADSDTTLSLGDGCVAFIGSGSTLKSRGKKCRIYYVAPLTVAPGVSKDGLVEISSLFAGADNDAFRVKPAPADADQ